MRPYTSKAVTAVLIGLLCVVGLAAQTIADATVQTPHGRLFVHATHFSNGDADHPCEFNGVIGNLSTVGWRHLDLLVKLSGMSMSDWGGKTISVDIPVRIDVIAGNVIQIAVESVEFSVKCDGSSHLVPSQMTARFVNGIPDKNDVDHQTIELRKVEDALAPYNAEVAKLPILKTGSSVGILASDQKCAQEFQQVPLMEGVEKRKRIAELVQYECGSIIDVPVRLVALSTEEIERLMDGAAYIKVTVADCASGLKNCPVANEKAKGKTGWVPAKWVTNY